MVAVDGALVANFDYHNPYYPNHDLQYESGTNIESFRYFQIQNHDLCFKNRYDRLIVISLAWSNGLIRESF